MRITSNLHCLTIHAAAHPPADLGLAKSDEQVLIRQGVEIGRSSEIFVRATLNDDRVSNVRVGGHAIEVLRGTVTL